MNPEQQAVEKAFKPLIDAKSKRKLSVRITDLKEFDETKEGLSFKKIIKLNMQNECKTLTKKYFTRVLVSSCMFLCVELYHLMDPVFSH